MEKHLKRTCSTDFAHRTESNHSLRGFTLAEVLITLGIIGVVAALTLPSLIANYQEKESLTRLKKAYSIIQQASVEYYTLLGSPANWEATNSDEFRDLFDKKINYVKKCDRQERGCWYDAYTMNIKGTSGDKILDVSGGIYSTAVLSDGTILAFAPLNKKCNDFPPAEVCNQVIVDINGFKKPNQWGKDVFAFIYLKNKLVPRGTPEFQTGAASFNSHCLPYGHACAGWALVNENRDYLKCDDLEWNTKTSCK